MSMRFKKTIIGMSLLVLLVFSVEIVTRVLGIADVPIREANPVTGYIPVASQSGSFLNNTWHINEMQMISRKEFTSRGDEVLVVGDSIVFGGNALDQSERVGEQLDALFETRNVYAIADGSWTFKNSVNYLASRKDDLLQLQDIVFVLNSPDFEAPPSSWRCMSFHPTVPPSSAAYFAYRKFFSPQCLEQSPPELTVPDFDVDAKLNQLVEEFKNSRFSILLYQNKAEWQSGTSLRDLIGGGLSKKIDIYERTDFPEMWNEGFYFDGIHANAEGAAALAGILERILSG